MNTKRLSSQWDSIVNLVEMAREEFHEAFPTDPNVVETENFDLFEFLELCENEILLPGKETPFLEFIKKLVDRELALIQDAPDKVVFLHDNIHCYRETICSILRTDTFEDYLRQCDDETRKIFPEAMAAFSRTICWDDGYGIVDFYLDWLVNWLDVYPDLHKKVEDALKLHSETLKVAWFHGMVVKWECLK